ncbi:MAG: hypothetical protein ACRDZ8_21950 [Acidimicrobiales bacterium]
MTRTYVGGDGDADADNYDDEDEYEDYGDDAYEDEYGDEVDEYEDDGYDDDYDDEEDEYDDRPRASGTDEDDDRYDDDRYDDRGGAGFEDPGSAGGAQLGGARRGARSRTTPTVVAGAMTGGAFDDLADHDGRTDGRTDGHTDGHTDGRPDTADHDRHADADREAARQASLGARRAARRDRPVGPEPVARRDGTWEDFSWGPEKRSTGLLNRVGPGVLTVVAMALLVAGIAALLVHQKKSPRTDLIAGLPPTTVSTTTVPATTTTTVTTPPGDQRLADHANHISLAVPSSWVTESLQSSSMSRQLTDVATANPTVKGILALDIESLVHAEQLGVFAVNVGGNQSVFSYSVASPGTESLSQVPSSAFTTSLKGAGDRNVSATPVHLAVGDAEQVSAQTTFEGSTLSEVFDYFVQPGRVVLIALTAKSTQLPTTTFHQIEATVAGA